MFFQKFFYSILVILGTTLIILYSKVEFAGSPWLQIIATYLTVSLAFSFLIYLLFKKTRADAYAVSFLQLLFLGYLLIFLACIGNVVVRFINIVPLFFGYEPWVGNIFPGPYMWLAGLAIIPALFSLALSIYWDEAKRAEDMVEKTVGID